MFLSLNSTGSQSPGDRGLGGNVFAWPVCFVSDGLKLPYRPRTIRPLLTTRSTFCLHVGQRPDERCLARSDSQTVWNGANRPWCIRRWM